MPTPVCVVPFAAVLAFAIIFDHATDCEVFLISRKQCHNRRDATHDSRSVRLHRVGSPPCP